MRLAVPATAAGTRLDRFLAEALGLPRNQIQRWLHDGRVGITSATGAVANAPKPSLALAGGETIDYTPEVPAERETMVAEPALLALIYEDEQLAVLDKPAGVAVHPGAGRRTGTLAHHLLARYPEVAGVGGPGRPGIVHRLDRDTTGLMVIARTAAAYTRLAAQFAAREVDKRYLAIAYGLPRAAAGTIAEPIGRHPLRRQEMAVRPRGRRSPPPPPPGCRRRRCGFRGGGARRPRARRRASLPPSWRGAGSRGCGRNGSTGRAARVRRRR